MRIFSKILVKTIDNQFHVGEVLVSDTFENNNNLKVALVVDFEEKERDTFLSTKDIDYVVFRTSLGDNPLYGYINVERKEDGSIDTDLNDVDIDEDYSYESISRVYLFVDNEESIILMNNNCELLSDNSVKAEELEKVILKYFFWYK